VTLGRLVLMPILLTGIVAACGRPDVEAGASLSGPEAKRSIVELDRGNVAAPSTRSQVPPSTIRLGRVPRVETGSLGWPSASRVERGRKQALAALLGASSSKVQAMLSSPLFAGRPELAKFVASITEARTETDAASALAAFPVSRVSRPSGPENPRARLSSSPTRASRVFASTSRRNLMAYLSTGSRSEAVATQSLALSSSRRVW
jgi:hypothetical protein